MSLILAIEPDRRQATKVGRLAEQLQLELVIGESADAALTALGTRVPDLVLTSQLLVPKDEAALAERLRELGAAGAHVQTLVIPVLRGDDSTGKKKGGRGLFGRLRGDSRDDEKNQDGCDPAVFATEINDYLERGAAERAALAAAQADLEAAWADQPAPTVDVTPAPTPSYAAIDVHPDMVIEDPEALFGEFAAIPIKRAAPEKPDDPAVTPRRPEEEWEEIPLDIEPLGHTSGRPPASDAPPPVPHGVELTSEPVDLDAFVRDLHTVQSSANAQPMIPVVDLTDVFAGDISLPEPTVVDERELLEDERAAFEAEVTAVFGESAFAAAIDTSEPPLVPTADVAAEPLPDATPAAVSVQWPDFVAPQPVPAPTWVERPQTDWSAAIDALPPPPSVAPSVDAETAAPSSQDEPGWQDMLSAIRRDIKSLKTDEVAPAPAKPKLEFNPEPLVFPSRPAVAASVLSEFDAQVAQRTREADERARQAGQLAHEAEQLAREAQDRTRAAEEALRAAAATVVASQIVEASAPLPIDSAPSIFDARIDTDLMAVAFEPIVTLPPAEAQSPADASDALDWLLNAPPQLPAADQAVPIEAIAEVEPEPPAPTVEARPVVTPPFVTTPVSNANRQKPGKNKKKRRHEAAPPPSPAYVPPAVYAPIPEWGFFDLQRAEFGPLLARLNHDASDLRALPRR